MQSEYQEDEMNKIILEERHREMREIASDIEQLAEISIILAGMVEEQGEKIDVAETNIENSVIELEQSTISLENAEKYSAAARNNIKNAAIIIGGLTAGAFGFIAGPIIGVVTTISGITASIGFVFVS